jgi:hypothetical protein
MWLFTKQGFFSAVCARQGSGMHGQPVDPHHASHTCPTTAAVSGRLKEWVDGEFESEKFSVEVVNKELWKVKDFVPEVST